MNFQQWLHSTTLSESSIQKYYGAIRGVLTEWATEAGLIHGSILEITSPVKFNALILQINELSVFQERNNTGNKMYSNALNKYAEYLSVRVKQSIEEDIEEILSIEVGGTTEKVQLISARVGQGQFRESLLNYWGKCAVTGFANASMLLASHIKPWSKSNDIERLDKFNGLLLTPNLDRAFDQELISFNSKGAIILSSNINNIGQLGITSNMSIKLEIEHQPYMEFHRKNVFENT